MIYELNSTLKACLIAGFFPYIFHIIYHSQKEKPKFYVLFVTTIITLSASFILENRALTAATFLCLILWHIEYKWIKKNSRFILLVSLLLIIILLLIKWHSSLGRIFIWKIAIEQLSEYWLSGVGNGNFMYYYANWQSEWFRNNTNFSSFHLLADCPHYAFNEYLHLWIEFGLPGIIIFLLYTYFIFKIARKGTKKIEVTAALSSANMLLFAFISYPLHSFWVLLLLTFSAVIIFYSMAINSIIKYTAIILLAAIISIQVQQAFQYFELKKQWLAANNIPDNFDRHSHLTNIYINKSLPGEYIRDYASQLIATKNFHAAEIMLLENQKKINQYSYYLYMGEIFKETGNRKKAIIHYENAHFIIPNRFIPLYNLMKINLLEGNIRKALTWKKIIQSTPVKVNSQMVQLIKKEADKLY